MVTEAVRPGQGWRQRPDYLKTAKALAEDQAKASEAESLRERAVRLNESKRLLAQKKFEGKIAVPPKGTKPELVWVRAGDVRFDPRYQTEERYDERRARRIAEEWDWNTPTLAITVNVRPGDVAQTVWCPDGRHRTNAAIFRFGEDVKIPALMNRVTYEEEAAMFAHQDEHRKRVSDSLKFNAGKEAGEAMALEAQAVADRLSLGLGYHATPRGMATKTFVELIRTKGAVATEEALRFILDRWGGEVESMDSRLVKGMTWFVARYRDHPHYRAANVREALAHVSVARVTQDATRYQMAGEHKRIAAAIVGIYNHQRRNRLPEWGVS